MAKSWSILLFGVGLLLTIMAWLPGESAWAALRMGLFGVCGVGTYLLGPFMLYWAVLVAFGQPVRAKCLKGAAFLVMLCGVVMAFSGIDLAGLDFAGYVQAVYKTVRACWAAVCWAAWWAAACWCCAGESPRGSS